MQLSIDFGDQSYLYTFDLRNYGINVGTSTGPVVLPVPN